MDIRNEMMITMIECGLDVEAQHHEVATAGQSEIDLRFDELVKMGDNMCLYKYIIKNVAKKYNKTVTFMPKPLFSDNGSGMHTHISLWKGGKPLFAGNGYAGLSEMGLFAIGGLLKHAPAILAFTNPTTNSYKRLVPGYEAPVNLAYSQRNRSASCRIPMYSPSPKAKRVEFRCPDPSCNPYLAFATVMMAALDGIQNKIHPGEPLDKDIYDLAPEELAEVPKTPGSLGESLDALAKDHEFLLRGDVFTEDVINTWISYKQKNEVDAMALRPHPVRVLPVLRHVTAIPLPFRERLGFGRAARHRTHGLAVCRVAAERGGFVCHAHGSLALSVPSQTAEVLCPPIRPRGCCCRFAPPIRRPNRRRRLVPRHRGGPHPRSPYIRASQHRPR